MGTLRSILQIGAIYAPLDVNIPAERLQVIVADCKPAAVLVNTTTVSKTGDLSLPSSIAVLDVSNLPNGGHTHAVNVTACDPAVILLTSGTSAVPKGVVLSHGNFCNHVEALTVTHGFGSETALQQSSVGFDMSLNQIFIALANGGTLVIVPESLRKDFAAVARILLDHEITYTSATPSEYLAWFRHGADSLFQSKSWRFATAGGEQFSTELVQAFRQLMNRFEHSFRIFNDYGPTECSLSSNELEVILESQHITAGRTLPNYAIYIIDEDLNPLPIGFPGEIYIAGAGVAIGYLNNPEDTERKFLKTSFADKMYHTRDRGLLRADGTLEFLGRIDSDTQSILTAANGQVSEVVFTSRGNPTILVAHAVLSSTAPTNTQQFLQTLAASLPLPQYMHPAAILTIDRITLTTSASDFFHVGGDSMLLIELRNFVRREFDVTLPLLRLFEHSTLSAMSSAIHPASNSEKPSSIDWASEIAIPSSLLTINQTPSPPSHLLRSLTTNSNIIKIHCLPVRDPSNLASFTHSEKVVLHTGDLSLPYLGLSPAAFAALSASADAIIHNGADVSFLKTYASGTGLLKRFLFLVSWPYLILRKDSVSLVTVPTYETPL
ncbi:putative NRPS-like enzyme [Aspergillus clavatus NRRL 1]|uniref:NRPS-like enzyme, putative n=1 Tax=Aspergillus clavatus (strain ATCC 1007 / CBS 513.65 / DSM 816 / NCTC 3887 / NRRL 1 / QM 1276 / 107) TaxID=344612 RepID=A1C5P7_ASPCL|nr:NRPS-like enzyme, putative [Aspergillus clavatus NRRL 1]EAW15015.1 NRPS-like enzyme, putative [Aspergillus clavatus NRRL 1]